MADSLRLPGISGSYASAPDSAALSITGDIDIRILLIPDTTRPAAISNLVAKWTPTGNQRSFVSYLAADGKLHWQMSTAGTASTSDVASTVAVPSVVGGPPVLWRITSRQSDGRIQFFTGSTWGSGSQLGADVTGSTSAIFDSTALLEIGSQAGGTIQLLGAKVLRVQIRNNILDDGTGIQFDADFTSVVKTGTETPTTFVEGSSNAATVTINGTSWAWLPVYPISPTCLSLPGVASSYGSAPDSTALSITDLPDIRMLVSLDKWGTLAASMSFVSKYGTAGQRSFGFYISTSGTPHWITSADGTATTDTAASVGLSTRADGALIWVRVTWRTSDGRIQFFTAPGTVVNPVTADWTQLGTDRTGSTSAIFDSTAVLEIGSQSTGASQNLAGKIYRTQIRNNILDDGTGIVFDADFTTVIKTFGRTPTTLIESSSNGATVTINGTQWDWFDGWAMIAAGTALSDSVDRTSYTFASWTPRPNRLYVAFVQYDKAATPTAAPTLSGNSMTWTHAYDSGITGTTTGLSTFVALSGSAPAAGTTVADFGGVTQTGGCIQIIEVDGADLSGTALAAIVRSEQPSTGSQATPWSQSYTNIASGSRDLVGFTLGVNENMNPRTNWTELADAGHGTPAARLETQWRADSNENTYSVSYTTTSFLRGVILEIREASLPRQAIVAPSMAALQAASW